MIIVLSYRFLTYKEQLMKTYTIIGGVNGSGKSSLTGVLKSTITNMGKIVDPDKIAQSMGGDTYLAGQKAIEIIEKCLDENICFTQESTLSGGYTRKVAQRAQDQGYYIRLYYVGLNSAQECLDRIENRVKKGGHNIPHTDVIKRFNNRYKVLVKILPYCNEVKFFDNDNGFIEIAEYKNGELFIKTKEPSPWLLELRDYLESEQ